MNAASTAQVLFFGVWAASQSRITANMLLARDRPDLIAKVYALELLTYGPLLFWLMHVYGIVGAAVAWAVRVIADSFLMAYLCGLVPALVTQAVWSVPMIMLAILIAELFPVEDPIRWIASTILLVFVAGWSAFFMPPQLVRLAHMLPGLRYIPLGILKQN